MCVCVCVSVCLRLCVCVCLSVSLSVSLSVCMRVHVWVHVFVCALVLMLVCGALRWRRDDPAIGSNIQFLLQAARLYICRMSQGRAFAFRITILTTVRTKHHQVISQKEWIAKLCYVRSSTRLLNFAGFYRCALLPLCSFYNQ